MKEQTLNKPAYQHIADDIFDKIRVGVLKPFEPMPSEMAIGETYGVSRLTVRKAMDILEKRACIITEPGKGSFVREISKDNFSVEIDRRKLCGINIDHIHVLNVAIIESTKELVYKLQIPPVTRVIMIERLMYHSDWIIAYDVKYIPYYTKIPLTEDNLADPNFEQIIKDRASLYTMDKELLIYIETSNDEIAQHMRLNAGYPLMVLDETLSDSDAGVIGWGKTYYDYKTVAINGNMIASI